MRRKPRFFGLSTNATRGTRGQAAFFRARNERLAAHSAQAAFFRRSTDSHRVSRPMAVIDPTDSLPSLVSDFMGNQTCRVRYENVGAEFREPGG
jgi:hypothetical protein